MTDVMSSLLDRLTAAGWVASSVVSDQSLAVNWTAAGVIKAQALKEAIEVLDLFDFDADELSCLAVLLEKTLPEKQVLPSALPGPLDPRGGPPA